MKVLVTGSSGYIGGQTVLQLKDLGHYVIGVDWAEPPAHLVDAADRFIQEDFASQNCLREILTLLPDAIVHCAGTSLVGPSLTKPTLYYDNNFVKTKRLIDTLVSNNYLPRLVFSSSAAVYGETLLPCNETDATRPISPYGESKLMIEMLLRSYRHAYNFDSVAFRYFNACGADSQTRHGQAPGATHIIARVLESIRDDREFTLYGRDYDTVDGTCVRDYVHVEDIVRAHVMAIDAQLVPQGIYNLGTKRGVSNLEIIKTAEAVTGQRLRIADGDRRIGDPGVLTADPTLFNQTTNWSAYYTIEQTIEHAWRWYSQ
jgi:UDP-glucose 4-epimerase